MRLVIRNFKNNKHKKKQSLIITNGHLAQIHLRINTNKTNELQFKHRQRYYFAKLVVKFN